MECRICKEATRHIYLAAGESQVPLCRYHRPYPMHVLKKLPAHMINDLVAANVLGWQISRSYSEYEPRVVYISWYNWEFGERKWMAIRPWWNDETTALQLWNDFMRERVTGYSFGTAILELQQNQWSRSWWIGRLDDSKMGVGRPIVTGKSISEVICLYLLYRVGIATQKAKFYVKEQEKLARHRFQTQQDQEGAKSV